MSFLKQNRSMLVAFVLLVVLLGTNIGVTFLGFGTFRLVLHLGTAVFMAATIVTIFMDLRHAGGLMRVFALGGLLWLVFMWILFPVDYLTR